MPALKFFRVSTGIPPGMLALNRRYDKGFRLNETWKDVRDSLTITFAAHWVRREEHNGPISVPVAVSISETWPMAKGDIDSPIKAVLDALQHAEVIVNDSQVVELYVCKKPPGNVPGLDVEVVWVE